MSKALDDIESDFLAIHKRLFDSPMVVELEVDPNLNHVISVKQDNSHYSWDTMFGIASIHITHTTTTQVETGDHRNPMRREWHLTRDD
ncbi:uncharacterized protein G2W53_029925 [Senna tora]|uniref:Uncharacterized protein n=1 Tax=Senna tora TaxID=362788 RepID=A0A834T8D3_9FABA|nr:uncharacterized protein G2W53_029925 [Senna tora]